TRGRCNFPTIALSGNKLEILLVDRKAVLRRTEDQFRDVLAGTRHLLRCLACGRNRIIVVIVCILSVTRHDHKCEPDKGSDCKKSVFFHFHPPLGIHLSSFSSETPQPPKASHQLSLTELVRPLQHQ